MAGSLAHTLRTRCQHVRVRENSSLQANLVLEAVMSLSA
jgi:hypothetical protein